MSAALPRVEAYLAALRGQSLFGDEKTPGSVLSYIAFYQQRAPSRRIAFRTAGFFLLFLSISLPFITQSVPEPLQARVASLLSWLIAIVAAANSFFNWQKAWQLHVQTEMTLRFALTEWDMRVAEALAESSEEAALKILKSALQQLAKTVTEAVASETAQYFEGVKAPQAPVAKSPASGIIGP